MVYEDICNFGMDQLVITQYKKILKILQENSNILILKIPIEKVKSKTSQLQSIPKRQKIDIFILCFET